MTIDVSDLIKKKVLKKSVHLIIESKEILTDNEEIQVSEPIKLDGNVNNIGDILILNGSLSAILELTCSRCLEKFTYKVDVDIHEKFSNNIDNEDEDVVFIEGDSINVTDIIENSIEMALPMKKLCNEECKGLCPNCGTNMNIHSCKCDNSDTDIRLAKLKDLFN